MVSLVVQTRNEQHAIQIEAEAMGGPGEGGVGTRRSDGVGRDAVVGEGNIAVCKIVGETRKRRHHIMTEHIFT